VCKILLTNVANERARWKAQMIDICILRTDECRMNSDCGSHGECKMITHFSYPQRQCFCQPGWFGDRCDQGAIYALLMFYSTGICILYRDIITTSLWISWLHHRQQPWSVLPLEHVCISSAPGDSASLTFLFTDMTVYYYDCHHFRISYITL